MTTQAEAAAAGTKPVRAPAPPPPPRRRLPETAWIWALAAALFVLYSLVSIRMHQRLLSTGFDLGIVEQAVRSYASGELPVSEIKGPDFAVLGDHFAPVLALLAPFYRAFPSPVTLLVAQAALLAVAVVPLAGWAQRTLGRQAALVIGLGYGLSWGIAQAVGFDVHEVAFAVPLIAYCAVALGEQRWVAAVLWALPLVLVKEDLGLTVAAVGGLVAWFGPRALGLATVAFGLTASAVTVLVILPANTPEGTFSAWRDAHFGGAGEADTGWADRLERYSVGLVSPEPKAILLLLLVAPTAMLAVRSPLLLLAVPTLAWRLTSDYENYWGTGYHYSAILMPIVFAAFVDGMRRRSHLAGVGRQREALAISAAVTALLLPSFPLWSALAPSTWKDEVRVSDARAAVDRVPDGVRVAASNNLVPQLANRTSVSLFGHSDARPNPQYIVVDVGGRVNWPFGSRQAQEDMIEAARALGYTTVAEHGDFLVLRRDLADPRQFPPPPPPEDE